MPGKNQRTSVASSEPGALMQYSKTMTLYKGVGFHVARLRDIVCSVRSTHFNTGKSRDRRSKLKSCYGAEDSGRIDHGMGNGLSDKRAVGTLGDQQKELDLSDPFGPGDRCVMVMLLQGTSDRRRFKGRTYR